MSLNFNPLDFFKEEIENDTAAIRIEAVSNLHLIASALGPQRTVGELVPYLAQVIHEEAFKNDEEFLQKVAAGLGDLPQYMPGERLDMLIPPLETLCAQEETVIRTTAVESLCSIVNGKPQLVQQLLPCLHRLATKNDFFTARVSACSLFPSAYEHADEDEKAKLRTAFVTICGDETPMVRRAAANSMTDLARVFGKIKEAFAKELLDAYKTLSQEDTQDTIRASSVNTTIELAKFFNDADNEQYTVPVIKDASEDRSWRVRMKVAMFFPDLCKAFSPTLVSNHLLKCQQQLLRDQEFEVRKATLNAIENAICNSSPGQDLLTTDQISQFLMPELDRLVADSSKDVRAALANILGPLAKVLGEDKTKTVLFKYISTLLKDESHDVRLNIVKHAGLICEVVSVGSFVSTLLTEIEQMKEDNNWRIRESVTHQVPKLAKKFGKDPSLVTRLENIFFAALRDSVWQVRTSAIQNIADLVKTFDTEWTQNHLCRNLDELYGNQGTQGFANRITVLKAIPEICKCTEVRDISGFAESYVANIVIQATKDTVPNVKYYACEVIEKLLPLEKSLPASFFTKLQDNGLTALSQDSDGDVQFLSQKVLKDLPKR
jgi:serine/threonine-protein phosphatase 2A regulatory subunit A